MSIDVPRCDEKVWGYEWPVGAEIHICDKKARFNVKGLHGIRTVCGTHRRSLLRRGFKDTPPQQPMSEESGE